MIATSWIRRSILTAALAVASASAISAPVVVNFDSTFFGFVGPSQVDTAYVESGFRFTPTGGDAMIDLSFCALGFESCITNNTTQYLTALNDTQVSITASNAFSLSAFDASFFPLPMPPGLFSGLNLGLRLTGELWGGGLVEQIVALVEDTWPGDYVFSTYSGDAGLVNLRSLTLGACLIVGADCVRSGSSFETAGLLLNDMQFAIDNITFDSASTVPEPGALWLIAIGLGAIAVTRRRLL
jgi:hypothetical protein